LRRGVKSLKPEFLRIPLRDANHNPTLCWLFFAAFLARRRCQLIPWPGASDSEVSGSARTLRAWCFLQ